MGKVEGRAFVVNCNRCDEPILDCYTDGMTVRLSRFSVPLADARILGKYGRLTFNVWKGAVGLFVAYWHPSEGRPDKGRIYSEHFCLCRR